MILDIKSLNVSLKHRRVLSDISFTLDGGLCMLLGLNGSGKTTLLRAIMGFTPSEGEIWLDGSDFRKMPLRKRAATIAYLPQRQNAGLMMRVTEYVALGESPNASLFATPNAKALHRAEMLLDEMSLASIAHRTMEEISLGEMRLAGLARIHMQHAKLMLLDEPLSGLDFRRRHEFLNRMRAEKRTVLMSIHEPDLACQYADRILLISDQSLIADIRTDAVDPTPLTRALESIYGISMHLEMIHGRRTLVSNVF